MSTYAIEIEFGSNANPDEVKHWFDMLIEAVPEGASGKIIQRPLLIDVEKLTSQHAGSTINLHVPGSGSVTGTLEEVYPSGRHSEARTLVINGVAHTVTYGVAQLGEW